MFTANSKRQIKLRISQNIKRAAKNSLKQNSCIEKTNMELLTLGKEKWTVKKTENLVTSYKFTFSVNVTLNHSNFL